MLIFMYNISMKQIFKRSQLNPILKSDINNPLESKKVYNPGVIFDKGEYFMYYRAVGDDGLSRIRLAISKDGEHFIKQDETILQASLKIDRKGVEDPRIQKIGKKYYMTYTAYDGKCARLCLAVSKDLYGFKKQGKIFSDWNSDIAGSFDIDWDRALHVKVKDKHKEWCKAGGMFSEKIAGKYWMLFGDKNLWLAYSRFGKKWRVNYTPFIGPRDGYFDSMHVEMGPPPIETDEGWLILYHGIDEKAVYRLGYLLLDLDNPMNIIKRSDKFIFEPYEDYELEGDVDICRDKNFIPKVIFCEGAVLKRNKIKIYYGAGDSSICTAEAKLTDVLK